MKNIKDIASQLHIAEDDLILYGNYKAKVPLKYIDSNKLKNSNLILVSAISPTPAGEGKTTVSIGLTQGHEQNRETNDGGVAGAIPGARVWYERRCDGKRESAGHCHGRH